MKVTKLWRIYCEECKTFYDQRRDVVIGNPRSCKQCASSLILTRQIDRRTETEAGVIR